MSFGAFRQDKCEVTVGFWVNGRTWTFSHTRPTEADADNFFTLLQQKHELDKERTNESERLTFQELATLRRSNAALRALLRKKKAEK